jgi:putative SOS response-associated peptidase YedK
MRQASPVLGGRERQQRRFLTQPLQMASKLKLRSGERGICGRYVRKGSKQKIADYFRAKPNPNPAGLPMPDADYNIVTTTYQPTIRQSRETGEREMVLARWGLVPFFTKDLKDVKGFSTINARALTITKAPTWWEPFRKRRCLIPASSFGQYKRSGGIEAVSDS